MEFLIFLLEKYLPEKWKAKSASNGTPFFLLGSICLSVFALSIAALGTSITRKEEVAYKRGLLTEVSIKKHLAITQEHRSEYFLAEFKINSEEPEYFFRFDDSTQVAGCFKISDSISIAYLTRIAPLASGYRVLQANFGSKKIGDVDKALQSDKNISTIIFLMFIFSGLGTFYLFKSGIKYRAFKKDLCFEK